jgi:hypothetical protein
MKSNQTRLKSELLKDGRVEPAKAKPDMSTRKHRAVPKAVDLWPWYHAPEDIKSASWHSEFNLVGW